MRVFGRVWTEQGTYSWQTVTTDSAGNDDLCRIVHLAQVIRLNPNESPFYADWGIAALQSVQQIVPPDIYIVRTQQRFSPYFASIIITKTAGTFTRSGHAPSPTYRINVITHDGAILPSITVPTSIPT